MKMVKRVLAGLLGVGLLTLTADAAEVYTQPQMIGNYNTDGRSTYYFRLDAGSPGWGAPGCPQATYVYLRDVPTDPTCKSKDLFNAALAAMALGKKVSFRGTCDDAVYFRATYLLTY